MYDRDLDVSLVIAEGTEAYWHLVRMDQLVITLSQKITYS